MARRDLLRRMQYKSPTWFVVTPIVTLLGVMMLGVPMIAPFQKYTALDVTGSLGLGFLLLPVGALLWAKAPTLTPYLVETDNTFKPWAIRALWASLAVAFGLIAAAGYFGHMQGIEGSIYVAVVGAIFAVIFVLGLFGTPKAHSSERFGLIHPHSGWRPPHA